MEFDEELKKLQKKHREKLKEKRDSIAKRKARTRRLIEHGAVAESFIEGSDSMSADEFKSACKAQFESIENNAKSPLQEPCGSNPR